MEKLKSMVILVVAPLVLVLLYWVAFDHLELAPPPNLFGSNYLKLAATVTPAAASPLQAPTSFDYFMLALQWGPTVCGNRPGCPKDFKIHGLWPEDFQGDEVYNCPGPRFTPVTDPVLKGRLDNEWPDLIALNPQKNPLFWEKEWNKHGKCAFRPQNAYLTLAVDLKDKFKDLDKHLPPPGKSHRTKDIVDAVRAYTKAIPDLMCFTKGRQIELQEVRICFDKAGNVMDCRADCFDCSCYRYGRFKTMVYIPQ